MLTVWGLGGMASAQLGFPCLKAVHLIRACSCAVIMVLLQVWEAYRVPQLSVHR